MQDDNHPHALCYQAPPPLQIAAQLAVTIAKVARSDFPSAWPSLFHDLLALLHAPSSTPQTSRRIYLSLHVVLKELASKRLAADQRVFVQVVAMLLDPLWQQWAADTQTLASELPAALTGPPSPALASQSDPVLRTLERWLLVLKALRRVLLSGSQSDARTMQPVDAVVKVRSCAAITLLLLLTPMLLVPLLLDAQQRCFLTSRAPYFRKRLRLRPTCSAVWWGC